ncbi:MAG: helix-turn-helix domain-containing protein [Bdellovibrionales bacterium]|nr:helix-turn-helix domain-containing protein [Bdellovibrionales bacterium]
MRKFKKQKGRTSKNTIQKDKNQLELILQVKESPKWVQPLKENQFVQAVNPIQSLQKPLTAKHKNSVKPAKAKQNTNLSKKEKRIKLKALSLEEVKTEKNTLKKAPPNGPNPKEEELFDNLISVEELAVIFGLAPQTIRNWIALGKIPHVKLGRKHFFQERSVQRWLNRKEEPQWP